MSQSKLQEQSITKEQYVRAVRDLRITIVITLALTLLILAGESVGFSSLPAVLRYSVSIPRLVLGLAYVLYIPGYWLTAALFVNKYDLDGIERIGMSLGLSVAWVPIIALILDYTPWGLRLWPILLGQFISCLMFITVAFFRRSRQEYDALYIMPKPKTPRAFWSSLSKIEKRIYMFCIASLLMVIFAAAWIFLVPSDDEFMTEYYILGAQGLAEEYPREAVPGEILSVTMGIKNIERDTHTYTVEIWAIDIWEKRHELVNTYGTFTLGREESVELPVEWSMPWAGQDQQVEFRLYSDIQEGESVEPYRLLRLWLDVEEP